MRFAGLLQVVATKIGNTKSKFAARKVYVEIARFSLSLLMS